jgi:hypothetical protein
VRTIAACPSLFEAARVLSDRHLGTQRKDALGIARTLASGQTGRCRWASLWRGREGGLLAYQVAMCGEWKRRGRSDQLLARTAAVLAAAGLVGEALVHPAELLPTWWGDPAVHSAHRGFLLEQDKEWYGRWGWDDDPSPTLLLPALTATA